MIPYIPETLKERKKRLKKIGITLTVYKVTPKKNQESMIKKIFRKVCEFFQQLEEMQVRVLQNQLELTKPKQPRDSKGRFTKSPYWRF